MQGDWAAQNLQVIRTMMERSALYRRALAPVMVTAGLLGLVAAAGGVALQIVLPAQVALYWLAVGVVAAVAILFLVRRQALHDREPVWSPPAQRVAVSLAPNFLLGLALGFVLFQLDPRSFLFVAAWIACYGAALQSASFFMKRGVRLFGWIGLSLGILWFFCLRQDGSLHSARWAHHVMGGYFGLLHLAYGIYLYATEKKP